MTKLDADGKAHLLAKHARNEPLALEDPAAFLAQRGLEVPPTLGQQRAAVRAIFLEARKAHGIE